MSIATKISQALGRGCSGDYEAIHTYVGIAAQMIYSLGGHLNTRSHARDLFWVTYFLDKDLTMRTGRRPTISDEHCDLTLPELYCERIIYLDAHDQPFPSDLRLSVIKSKIFNCLYSSSARKVCNTDIIRAVRELDEELEEWRVSLPSEHRPSLSQCDYAPCEEIRWIFIQSEYIHCIRMIHEATSRCIVWAENNDNLEALSSSLAISIEASRAYLTFLYSVPRQDFSFASYW